MVHTIHRFCIIPKDTPTQVFVHTTDNPLWTAGKTLMPTITLEEFDTKSICMKKALSLLYRTSIVKNLLILQQIS